MGVCAWFKINDNNNWNFDHNDFIIRKNDTENIVLFS